MAAMIADMPEGHVLHRAARLQAKRFVGTAPEVSSPQGRFAEEAERLQGQRLERITARGKHLFHWWDADLVVHIHLGLFGRFRMRRAPFPEPSPNCRYLLETDDDQLHLSGPTTCELLEPDGVDEVLARLGPDPLAPEPDAVEQLVERLSRRRIPIGRALLDQSVLAGVGNVYRSELLFLLGIHPFVPARDLDPDSVEALWKLAVEELERGERSGRIVTVDPDEVGAPNRRALKRADRLYAYKRRGQPCRRCDATIRSADIDGRDVWWCPSCQPE